MDAMNRRFLVIAGIAVAVFFTLYLSRFRLTAPMDDAGTDPGSESYRTTNKSQPVAQSPTRALVATNQNLQQAFSNSHYVDDWRKPIAFYGKVVDESGKPLGGVEVLLEWNDVSPSGSSRQKQFTDTDGLFSLTGVSGRLLTVKIEKSQYSVVRKDAQFSFEYARQHEPNYHRPDSSRPKLFKMRKLGPGAVLITSKYGVNKNVRLKVPRDGQPVLFDLLRRKQGDNGQISLINTKPVIQKWRSATEWSLQIKIPDGGLVEHKDEFPFAAPKTGYQPIVEFYFTKESPDWVINFKKQFYIAFGNPRLYGWLNVQTQISTDAIRLEYAINPDGSQYLEPKSE
jgi:hypothetical protein